MTWNYRICHRPSVAGSGYCIHEVYYDSKGRIEMITERPMTPNGDVPDDLYEDMALMWKAFDDEPINLDYMDKLLKRVKGKNQ